jgi:AcrR family transcriptional regulator
LADVAKEAAPRKRQIRRGLPEERHDDLIQATLRSLAKHGPVGTTVRAIAREADLSAGLITYHFGGKQALLIDAYRHLAQQMRQAEADVMARPFDSPSDRLDAFLRVGFEPPFLTEEYITGRFLFWVLARTDPDVGRAHAEIYDEYRRRLAELVGAVIGDDADRTRIVFGLSALLDGLWLEWCLDPECFDVDDMLEACRSVLRGGTPERG